jgi:hypothetical protein
MSAWAAFIQSAISAPSAFPQFGSLGVSLDREIGVIIGRPPNWAVVGILVYAQEWIVKWIEALFDFARRSELGNGFAGADDHDPLPLFYQGYKA